MKNNPIKMARTSLQILVSCLLLVSLSGCWDRIEIEDRGFVIAVGLDPAKSTDNPKDFQLIQQIVIPGALSGQGAGKSGTPSGKAYQNLVAAGDTVLQGVHNAAAFTNRSPFYEHLKVVVISRDIAKSKAFENVIDFFIRSSEIRRGVKFLIVEGSAEDVLNINPPSAKLPAIYIDSISENNYKNIQMLPPSRMGDLSEKIFQEQSYMIQKIYIDKSNLRIQGAAVFDGFSNKLIGFLNGSQTAGVNFIQGDADGGVIKAKVNGHFISYKIQRTNSKVTVNLENPHNVKIDVQITTEGDIFEVALHKDLFSEKMVLKMEKAISDKIKKKAESVIKVLQEDYKADVLGIDRHISGKQWPTWNRIKEDWDNGKNYFSSATFNVDVKTWIRNIGTMNKTNNN